MQVWVGVRLSVTSYATVHRGNTNVCTGIGQIWWGFLWSFIIAEMQHFLDC